MECEINIMNWDVKLAKEFKKRDNKKAVGAITGVVIGINPLSVSIYDGNAIFTGDNLYVCEKADAYTETADITINGTAQQATIEHKGLNAGDKVACIATEDNQNLFVIDKIS